MLNSLLRFKAHAQTSNFFESLVSLKFNPLHIVDIGAHKGAWTKSAMQYFPDSFYTLFEPQAELLASSSLTNMKNVTINNVGVGASSGVSPFTLSSRKDSSSFMFSHDDSVALDRVQAPIEVITLDDYFLNEEQSKLPSIVKIDAEGWDENVVHGSSMLLPLVPFVLVECSVLNPHFSNTVIRMMQLMQEKGFKMFDITDLNRSPKSKLLWNIEMAFYNPKVLDLPPLSY